MSIALDFDLSDRDAIRAAIAVLQGAGAIGLATIFRDGVLSGRCAFAGISNRDSAFPVAKLATFTSPTIVLVGDDDDLASGPLKWRCAKAAGRWANAVMVHGAGAEEAHYRAAIEAAQIVQRVVLVETSSTFVDVWARFLGHPRTLLVRTREGVQHPAPREPGDLH